MSGQSFRNIAIVGSPGSGKTSLMESLLFVSGAISRKGKSGSMVGDSSKEAVDHQMSTEVSCAHFQYSDLDFTLIDCPGSSEFQTDTFFAVTGCDLAVVVIEPDPERMIAAAPVMHHLELNNIPHMVFINKMDRSNVRYRDLLARLRELSLRPVVPQQYAIGRGESLVGYIDLVSEQAYHYLEEAPAEKIPLPDEYEEREQVARSELVDTLADFDDILMEKVLEDQEPSQDELTEDLLKGLSTDQVVPVLMGVAEKNMGVRRLLDVLCHETPEPSVRASQLGFEEAQGQIVQVLKNYYLAHVGKISLVRVWNGNVTEGETLSGNRVGSVLRLFGQHLNPASTAQSGQIAVLTKMEEAKTGQLLTSIAEEATLYSAESPSKQPVYAKAISCKNRADDVKLSGAFTKICDEDPSLQFEHHAKTQQLLLWGQGELHLTVALDRLKNKYGIEVETSRPATSYQETIKTSTQAHGRHKKQSGGHGQFGDVKIEIQPLERGKGFVFTNKIVGGAVPRQFIPAVEHGALEYMDKGPLGFPVVDIAVTLHDGQFHSVDSNELSFKLASAAAMRDGLVKCKPILLEPVLEISFNVPAIYTSKVLPVISQKRGQILGYDATEGWQGWDTIKALIPEDEIHDLINILRSISQGTGYFSWKFDHFQEVPGKIAGSIVSTTGDAHSH